MFSLTSRNNNLDCSQDDIELILLLPDTNNINKLFCYNIVILSLLSTALNSLQFFVILNDDIDFLEYFQNHLHKCLSVFLLDACHVT